MANIYFNLPLPVLNGPGASVNVSTAGKVKTIVVEGRFPGATITIEASVDGGVVFAPVHIFQDGDEQEVVEIAAQFMRVNVSGRKTSVPFTAAIDIGTTNEGALFLALPLPVGNGAGPSVNATALGTFCTFIAGGSFPGAVIRVEVSEDGANWAPVGQFSGQGGSFSKEITGEFFRANVAGRKTSVPFTGTLAVGAINDASGGATPAGPSSTCLIYQPGGGQAGPGTFDTWADVMTALAALRAAANGGGCYTIMFDNSFVSPLPALIPAGGPYDMTDVMWEGGSQYTQNDPAVNFVAIDDGATFLMLRRIRNLRIENRNGDSGVAADSTLGSVSGDLIQIETGSYLYSTSTQPFWRELSGPTTPPACLVQFSTLASGPIVDITTAGTVFSLVAGYLAVIDGSTMTGVAGALLILIKASSSGSTATEFVGFPGVAAVPGAAATLRPNPFDAAPAVAALPDFQIGDMAIFDVSGGPVVQTLPSIGAGAPTSLKWGGVVAVKETSGTMGLSLVPAAGDDIDGGGGPLPVPPGGSVVLCNDGFSVWYSIAIIDPADGPASQCLVFQEGGPSTGPVVFNTWAALMARLTQLRTAAGAGGGGCYTIAFDDTFAALTIPAGAYNMTDVTWAAVTKPFGAFVTIADGASFTGLRTFQPNLVVLNANTVTPAVSDLVSGDLITIHDFSDLSTVAGGAPFFSGAGLVAGDVVLGFMYESSSTGAADVGVVFDFPVAGTFFRLVAEDAATPLAATLSGGVGAILQLEVSSLGNVHTIYPAWAGTVLPPILDVPPTLLPIPYLTGPSAVAVTPFFGRWLALSPFASGGITQPLPPISASPGNFPSPGGFVLVTALAGGPGDVVTVVPAAGDTIKGGAGVTVPHGGAMLFVSDGVSDWSIVSAYGDDPFSPPEKWGQNNVAASQVAVPLSALVSVNFDTIKMQGIGGSIIGIVSRLTEAVTAGTLTVTVTIDGVPGTLALTHTSVLNPSGGFALESPGIDIYLGGSEVGINIDTDAGFLPNTTDIEVWLLLAQNPLY